jgi:hypothetical protein
LRALDSERCQRRRFDLSEVPFRPRVGPLHGIINWFEVHVPGKKTKEHAPDLPPEPEGSYSEQTPEEPVFRSASKKLGQQLTRFSQM